MLDYNFKVRAKFDGSGVELANVQRARTICDVIAKEQSCHRGYQSVTPLAA